MVAHCRRIGSAKLAIQLSHAGRKASAQRPWEGGKALPQGEDPWPTIAPSAIAFGPGWHIPRAMTEDDMAHVRDCFVAAAKRALRIGFDAVELHFAHGYLLHGFVSPISNTRNDAYGGSLDGRLRFPLEVVRAVRAVVPRGTPLGARFTGSDWLDGGLTVEDAVMVAKALKQAGLDYIDVSSGGVSTQGQASVPRTPGYNVPLAEQIRREAGMPTRVVGLIVSPAAGRGDRRRGPRRYGRAGPRLPRRSALGMACRPGAWRRGRLSAAISEGRSGVMARSEAAHLKSADSGEG